MDLVLISHTVVVMNNRRKVYEQLINGSIHIERNFLPKNTYEQMFDDIQKLKYDACHQPHSQYFGNRFQGYPVYEAVFDKYNPIILSKIENLVECKITYTHTKVRKVLASEVSKSKYDVPYGPVHIDHQTNFAAILPFYHSVSGGTAFFEYDSDKYPDISIGAYPNRLIIFNSKRFHAPCTDLTYDVSYKYNIFFNIENE